MEEPLSMARLAWIASELGSATRFPRKTIILQKPQPDEGLYSSCFSSMILSPLDGNVKMSPYEQGNICIEPERATTSGGYFQMREGGVGVCQSRRTPVPERAPN